MRVGRPSLEHDTNIIYGAINHLDGRTNCGHNAEILARPYTGHSDENVRVLREMVWNFLVGLQRP